MCLNLVQLDFLFIACSRHALIDGRGTVCADVRLCVSAVQVTRRELQREACSAFSVQTKMNHIQLFKAHRAASNVRRAS